MIFVLHYILNEFTQCPTTLATDRPIVQQPVGRILDLQKCSHVQLYAQHPQIMMMFGWRRHVLRRSF